MRTQLGQRCPECGTGDAPCVIVRPTIWGNGGHEVCVAVCPRCGHYGVEHSQPDIALAAFYGPQPEASKCPKCGNMGHIDGHQCDCPAGRSLSPAPKLCPTCDAVMLPGSTCTKCDPAAGGYAAHAKPALTVALLEALADKWEAEDRARVRSGEPNDVARSGVYAFCAAELRALIRGLR